MAHALAWWRYRLNSAESRTNPRGSSSDLGFGPVARPSHFSLARRAYSIIAISGNAGWILNTEVNEGTCLSAGQTQPIKNSEPRTKALRSLSCGEGTSDEKRACSNHRIYNNTLQRRTRRRADWLIRAAHRRECREISSSSQKDMKP